MKMRGIHGVPEFVLPMAGVGGSPAVADRIAAVYDRGIVEHALERRHSVAFFAIEGALAPRTRQTIQEIAESAFGVDRGSARVSVHNASLSLAFDPQRAAFTAIQCILDYKLATIKLSLLPMRILDEPSLSRS